MDEPSTTPPIGLTIAGSDSGGGAGLQADLKTFTAFGVFGTSVVTAVTAQNTLGVTSVHPVPLDVVRAQADAVLHDLAPAAGKTGMLATRELVELVADLVAGLPAYVLDPVMVSTSGHRLLDRDAERAVRELLLPRATVVTPNLHEARVLTDRPVDTLGAMREAARALVDAGARAALVKGGHLDGERSADVFFDGDDELVFERARVDTRHTHGTGCTLSAAVAAGLAHGRSVSRSVRDAIDFVARAIGSAPGLGQGHGPINHLVDAPPT